MTTSGPPVDTDNDSDDDVFDYIRMSKDEFDVVSGRKFRQGDFVASNSNPDKLLGQVVNINRLYAMYDSEDYTLRDIPSNELKRLTKFAEGDLVVLTHWLGRVYAVSPDVTVKFESNGSSRTFKGGRGLYPRSSDWDISRDRACPLHPGQEVMVSPGRRCTVTDVFDGSVFVKWLANSCCNNSLPPRAKQNPKCLTLVFPSRSIWKIGDVCRHVSCPETRVFLIVDIRTFLDVTWQDGTTENNLPSTMLRQVSDIGVHDFLPDQYVVLDDSEHLGVVKSVDQKEKTTTVMWICFPGEDIISSFHLRRHPFLNHYLGNLVYRQTTKEDNISYLSSFGSIIGFRNGEIEVWWADGTTSMGQPQVLNGVDRDEYFSDEYSSSGDEIEVEDAVVVDEIEVEDALVVQIPQFKVDLLDFVNLLSVECLNESRIHCISNALEEGYRELNGLNLESIEDEQLLICIPFKQSINLHSLVIEGHLEEGPKTVKLFANKEHFGFSDAGEVSPSDAVILSEENLRGKPVNLKQVRFQNIHSVVIFIEDNQSGSELTRLQKIVLYGTPNF